MANKHSGIDERLSQLGYRQDLRRRLHVWHVAGLAIATMSPTVTVILLATTVFSVVALQISRGDKALPDAGVAWSSYYCNNFYSLCSVQPKPRIFSELLYP